MNLEAVLLGAGMTVTRGRQEIFNLLKVADRPMTMNELLSQSPALDRATVYRTVRLFEKLGIVKNVYFGQINRFELSDNFVDHHHHIACKNCGRIEKLHSQSLEKQLVKLATKVDFSHTSHQVEILGLCKNCRLAP
jgi:Fur family ferric uptake transcriptional regulator